MTPDPILDLVETIFRLGGTTNDIPVDVLTDLSEKGIDVASIAAQYE